MEEKLLLIGPNSTNVEEFLSPCCHATLVIDKSEPQGPNSKVFCNNCGNLVQHSGAVLMEEVKLLEDALMDRKRYYPWELRQ